MRKRRIGSKKSGSRAEYFAAPSFEWRVGGQTAAVFLSGDAAMGEAVRGLAGKRSAMVLANHGPAVADIEAACNAIEELEDTARLAMLTRSHAPRMLTPDQIQNLVAKFNVEWDA